MAILATLLIIVTALLAWSYRRQLRRLFSRGRESSETIRVRLEDALKHLHHSESSGEAASVQGLAGEAGMSADQAAEVLSILQQKGLALMKEGKLALTPSGEEYALHVIRAHRLWERYLADQTGVSETEWHDRAHKLEHQLTPGEVDELAARLGNPTHDPHGDPVPTASGTLPPVDGLPLLSLEKGAYARIVHIEDEPKSLFSQLVDCGVHPGMEFRLLDVSPKEIVIRSEGSDRNLSSLAAANITVSPAIAKREEQFESATRLSELRPGEQGRVLIVSRATRAMERRRFMDLGILPGTVITVEFTGPGGEPVAYRIRGAVIALRKEQSHHIYVERVQESAA